MAGYAYRGTRTDEPFETEADLKAERKRRNAAAYRERNREKILYQQRAWHARNKDRVNANRREVYAVKRIGP